MRAPDYATLYNPEDALEKALRTLYQRAGFSEVHTARGNVNLPDTRIDITVELGGTMPGRDDAWRATLTIDHFTDRSAKGQEYNGRMRGTTRDLLCRYRACDPSSSDPAERAGWHPAFTEDILPFHVVNMLTMTRTDPLATFARDLDNSAIYFDVVISVRPGAHPA